MGRSTERARGLRAAQTRVENLLWEQLRAGRLSGWKFRRQHPIGRYIVDFACVQARLAVELDGGVHRLEEVIMRDLVRTEVIEAHGWSLLRFPNEHVWADRDGVLATILQACQVGVSDPRPMKPACPEGVGEAE